MKKFARALPGMLILVMLLCSYQFTFAEKDTVINVNNAGFGSLRAAIDSCNNRGGTLDTIIFLIPAPPFTINLTTSLPAITDAVFLNGYSQPGSAPASLISGTRIIAININGVGMAAGDMLIVNASDVTIAGLAIYDGPANGIRITSGNNFRIWGSYLGTNNTGIFPGLGHHVSAIVANESGGAPLSNIIVGTNGDGIADDIEGNIICGSGQHGIFFWRITNGRISGNLIGLNALGLPLANGRNGVLITVNADNNVVGTNGDGISDDMELNVISANGERGILIASISNGNVVAGNVVGLDGTQAAAGNGINGIEIFNGSNNRIGTNGDNVSDDLETNVICSNTGNGITITADDFFGFNSNSNGNVVAANYIGVTPVTNLVRGNTGNGIYLNTGFNLSANNNTIGSNNDGINDVAEGNVIANNNKGIAFEPLAGTSTLLGNKISRNSISGNTQTGIDLNDDMITANDNGDADTGPNELFNLPFITLSHIAGGNLTITGITRPNSIVEFYVADAGGEGQTFLFRAQEGNTLNGIADDSTGTEAYSDVNFGSGTDERFGFTVPLASLPVTVNSGDNITSLAIKAALNDSSTSEFGPTAITTLPVRLLEFKANWQNGAVYLSWATAQEINNSHFDIERSENGSSFKKLGSVMGRGNQTTESYSYVDNGPLAKVNFYRLKQVDKDGKGTYSKTLVVRGDLDKITAKVSPNPFAGTINIAFNLSQKEPVHVRLYDPMGRIVKNYRIEGNTGTNSFNLSDLGQLPAGNYTIELKGNNISFRQQIIKQ